MQKVDIAIIGAGVVGMTCALALLHQGRQVTLIDPNPPGAGCSYGNAGTIADYAVQPVGTPAVLRALPSLLFSRTSPLSIRRAAILSLMPWLARFLRQSLPGQAMRNAAVLAGLLADAGPRWRDLVVDCGADDLLDNRGCLYLYEQVSERQAAEADMAFRRRLGVRVELLDGAEVAAIEPGLPPMAGAAFFPGAQFLIDPGAMMTRLWGRVQALGGQWVKARVLGLRVTAQEIVLDCSDRQITAGHAVLSAGAHSRSLAQMAGDRVPLETERGYHAEWDMPQARLTRPACPTARGFYLCPMTGRLRVAGTVELGGTAAPPSAHRIAALIAGAQAIFPDLRAPDRTWLGFRPSLPDSLPVIGQSRAGGRLIHAFGHGHLGMTLAPVTAALVCGMMMGTASELDLAPLRPTRF